MNADLKITPSVDIGCGNVFGQSKILYKYDQTIFLSYMRDSVMQYDTTIITINNIIEETVVLPG